MAQRYYKFDYHTPPVRVDGKNNISFHLVKIFHFHVYLLTAMFHPSLPVYDMHLKIFAFFLHLTLICTSCRGLSEYEDTPVPPDITTQLSEKAAALSAYIRQNKEYNDSIALLINMKLDIGKKRCYIYDLKNQKILDNGLVLHGAGSDAVPGGELLFSNVPGSNCTSLGKYKIGKSYLGRFGKAYKLYGLDKTNDNTFQRYVVFHAHECVPEEETTGNLCLSEGCPTVSPAFFEKAAAIIDHSSRPVLMEIFYEP